jgi:uncharacterized protein YukJ
MNEKPRHAAKRSNLKMSHHHRPFDRHFSPESGGVKYGLLRGTVTHFGTEDGTKTPHFQIIVEDGTEQIWRVAVNVRSDDGSNDQAVAIDPMVGHPILDKLSGVAIGYTPLPDHTSGLALDFVREPLFEASQLEVLPPFGEDGAGLEDILTKLTQAALDTAQAGTNVFVWGSKFEVGNRPVQADTIYHNQVGIHDVHMNQGNPPPHEADNGSYQDGGIIFHFAEPERFVGFFMKFQSQVGKDDNGTVVIP